MSVMALQAEGFESPRLRFRNVAIADRDDLLEYWSRESYLEHSLIDPPTALSVGARIERALSEQGKDPRAEYFLVANEKLSGKRVGEALLKIRDLAWGQAEIGWGVHHDFLGRGFATEMGSALLRLGFDRLGMHRIYALCRVENAASRRVMSKLGMNQEGILRENVVARGQRWSSVQCSILATDPR